MSVARGESVQHRYTITSVLDEEAFDAASVLVGLKWRKRGEKGGSKLDTFFPFLQSQSETQ